MAKRRYLELEEKYPNSIILQLQGLFYNAYGKSSFIINEIFGYKLLNSGKTYRSAFPESILENAIIKIKELHINVAVLEGDKVIIHETFDDNKFNTFLEHIRNTYNKKNEGLDNNLKLNNTQNNATTISEECYTDASMTIFVQGFGITLENAILDVQRTVNNLESSGKKILSISLLRNKEASKDGVCIQGLITYEGRMWMKRG